MATFLYSAALGLLLTQSPVPSDSLRAELWARVTADSTDAPAWLELGRFYLQLGAEYHAHRKPVPIDTVVAHGTLDTAQMAFDRALRWGPARARPTRRGCFASTPWASARMSTGRARARQQRR